MSLDRSVIALFLLCAATQAHAQQIYLRQQGSLTRGHYPCAVTDYVLKDCAPLAVNSYTIATLPTPAAGQLAYVTDGDAGLAWGAAPVNSGGSSTKYLVWYNGAQWSVVGK